MLQHQATGTIVAATVKENIIKQIALSFCTLSFLNHLTFNDIKIKSVHFTYSHLLIIYSASYKPYLIFSLFLFLSSSPSSQSNKSLLRFFITRFTILPPSSLSNLFSARSAQKASKFLNFFNSVILILSRSSKTLPVYPVVIFHFSLHQVKLGISTKDRQGEDL